jgi:hypothetical protein
VREGEQSPNKEKRKEKSEKRAQVAEDKAEVTYHAEMGWCNEG